MAFNNVYRGKKVLITGSPANQTGQRGPGVELDGSHLHQGQQHKSGDSFNKRNF